MKEKRLAIGFIAPLALSIMLFQLYPILLNGFYSLLNWNGLTKTASFIGLENYAALFLDPLFRKAAIHSLIYALLGTFFQVGISFLLAWLVEFARFKKPAAVKLLFILPVAATTAVTGIVFKTLFSFNGPINSLIQAMGLSPVRWLADPFWAFVLVLIVSVWKETGTLFIYWMTGFAGVGNDVLEAASLDGARGWKLMRHIYMPVLKPILLMASGVTFINNLKVFDLVQTLTGGGPYYGTDMFSTFIYQNAFTGSFGPPRLSYACAAAVVILIGAILLFVIQKGIRKILNPAARASR